MEQLDFHWRILVKFGMWVNFRKSVEKIKNSIKIWQELRLLYMKTIILLWSYMALFWEREIFRTKVIENIETHILCSITFYNRAVYEIMWKNITEPDRPQRTMWRMRIVCWVHWATNTHSEYALLIAFPLQQRFSNCGPRTTSGPRVLPLWSF